jgi:hypothetical protein
MDGTTKMQYSPNSLLRKMVREDMMLFSSGEPLHALYPFPNNDREFSIVRLHPLRDALLAFCLSSRHTRKITPYCGSFRTVLTGLCQVGLGLRLSRTKFAKDLLSQLHFHDAAAPWAKKRP